MHIELCLLTETVRNGDHQMVHYLESQFHYVKMNCRKIVKTA